MTDDSTTFEKMVETALKSKGYTVKATPYDDHGMLKSPRVDMLAVKAKNGFEAKAAVECLLSDKPVDAGEVESFIKRLKLQGISRGIIASYGGFTPCAETGSKEHDVELWDYSGVVSRVRHAKDTGLTGKDVGLDINVLYPEAVALDLLNKGSVIVNSVTLSYHPYLVCSYYIDHVSKDKYGNPHAINERGRAVFDGTTLELIIKDNPANREYYTRILNEVMRHDDGRETTRKLEPPGEKYSVSVSSPAMEIDKAKPALKRKLGQALKRHVAYGENGPTDDDSPDMGLLELRPTQKDITIEDAYHVYVPSWEVEFQYKDKVYVREILASSNTTLSDHITECADCAGTRDKASKAIALCEECGKPFCKDHVHKCAECDTYLCHEHVSTCQFCGRHFCDTHARKECTVSEKYNSLSKMKSMPNMGLLRTLGVMFLLGAGILMVSTLFDTGGSLLDGVITLLFLGGPLSALTFSILIFGVVLVSLNYGKIKREKAVKRIPVLYHKILKKSSACPANK